MKKSIGVANTGSGKKQARHDRDFYPTPPEVTTALLEFLQLNRSCVIWEPAAGDGAISEVLKAWGYTVLSTDIKDGDDYLTAHLPDVDVIITNPPFTLASEFIRKAVSETPVVAMLLKSQFWHAAKRLPLFKECPPSYVLPLTWRPNLYGDRATGAGVIEFIWSVWCGKGVCEYVPLAKPKKIMHTDEITDADFNLMLQ
jgi:hypothetical protein